MKPGELFRVRPDADSLGEPWTVSADPQKHLGIKEDNYDPDSIKDYKVTAGDLFRLHENGDIEHAIYGFIISDLDVEDGDPDLEPVIGE